MIFEAINTNDKQKKGRFYSQAIAFGDSIYVSAQLPLNTKGEMAHDFEGQLRQCIMNLQSVLFERGLNLSYIVETRVYLSHMQNFDAMDAIYKEFFQEPYPARTVLGVSSLPKEAMVQIEAYAVDTRALELLYANDSCEECGEDEHFCCGRGC